MTVSHVRRSFPCLWLILAVVAATTCACSRQESQAPVRGHSPTTAARREITAPRLALASELTEQERKYGVAPTRNSQVTYQPGVVIVENGSEAIRGVSDNGLVWLVDADAVPTGDITPGKIVFLTSRAVGRVLDVQRRDGQLAITLGPVQLTEVIRDCDISMDQSVDFSNALVYTMADMPGASVETTPIAWHLEDTQSSLYATLYTSAGASDSGHVLFSHAVLYEDDASIALRRIANTTEEKMETAPVAELGELGVRITVNTPGLKMAGEASLHLLSPSLKLRVIISKGELMIAELELRGAAGLTLGFLAVSETGTRSNIAKQVQVPSDISIPILGPLPFTITIRQQFLVQTAFGAPGTLQAKGDYLFTGSVRVGYSKPDWSVGTPTGFSGNETLRDSIQGASLAVAGLSFTHQLKVIGGIGAFGFAVGPYMYLVSNVNATRNGDTDTLAHCRLAGFNMDAGVGVGYIIPQPVAAAINFILRGLNLRAIKGEGGSEGPRKHLIQKVQAAPNSPFCQGLVAPKA